MIFCIQKNTQSYNARASHFKNGSDQTDYNSHECEGLFRLDVVRVSVIMTV